MKSLLNCRRSFYLLLLWLYSVSFANAQTVDDSFNADIDNPFLSGKPVAAISFDETGRLLVAGSFTNVAGQSRRCFARLTADGLVDPSLTNGLFASSTNYLTTVVAQRDGKILSAGLFSLFGGATRTNVIRLNSDGSIDSTFSANATSGAKVNSLLVQEDGKIVAGGLFTTLGGQPRTCLGRFNSDGTIDSSFNCPIGYGGTPEVYCLTLQPDGKILVAGTFWTAGGIGRTNLCRITSSGTVDTNFNAPVLGLINAVAVQRDGKILVGGSFNSIANQPVTNLARLNSDGTLDMSFTPQPNGFVQSIALQTDGGIIIAGFFQNVAGHPCSRACRLKADGTFDSSFNLDISASHTVLLLQQDGSIYAGGDFKTINTVSHSGLARVINTAPATDYITSTDTDITWNRGGTGPEIIAAEFSTSMDGTNWTIAGAGQRISGGWQITGNGFNTNRYVRGRAMVRNGASSWMIQAISGALTIVASSSPRTNNAATTVTFSGQAIGDSVISYQWWKDGSMLANSNNVVGALTPTLVLTNVLGIDAGNYFLTASNSSGIVTSSVATLTIIDPVINVQPVSVYTTNGGIATFNVKAAGTAPVYQWEKNGEQIAGATKSTLTLTNVQAITDFGNYDVIVSNNYGAVTSTIVTLSYSPTPDSLATTFSSSGQVYATALQPDGKILVGGSFSSINGTAQTYFGRLNADGTLDRTFAVSVSSPVFSTIIQPDGKILAAGWFTQANGQPRTYIARFAANGLLDTTFDAKVNGGTAAPGIYSMALRSDGKILIAGDFTTVGGQSVIRLAQLNADGSRDTNFNASASDIVYPMLVQQDGKILVGGNFTTLCGSVRQHIGRLNADGTLDTTFDPGNNNLPLCFAQQADGKLLVGGTFTQIAGAARTNIARLNLDGTIDASFAAKPDALVRTMALQADGRILVGGNFGFLGTQTNRLFGRLLNDGTPDPTLVFDSNFTWSSYAVYSVLLQPDGRALLGGSYQNLSGRTALARLLPFSPRTNYIEQANTSMRWVLGGAVPQFSLMTVETIVGTNLAISSYARWTNGAWEIDGILTNRARRLRGFYSSGRYNSSVSIVETNLGPIEIVQQPADCTTNVQATVTFNVVVGGGMLPIQYQWFKDGALVATNIFISSVTNNSLTLTNVSQASAGQYFVVISNPICTVTSSVAALVIVDPLIAAGPTNMTIPAGSTRTLSVSDFSSAPKSYGWFHDGVLLTDGNGISGSQGNVLTIANMLQTNSGDYWLIVTNSFGSATSAVAKVTVLDPYMWTAPTNGIFNAGTSVTLAATVKGTPPISFQWTKNGEAISGETNSFLVLSNVQPSDIGLFAITASNQIGSVSAAAHVGVNLVFTDASYNSPGTAYNIGLYPDGNGIVTGSFVATNGITSGITGLSNSFNITSVGSAQTSVIRENGNVVFGGAIFNVNGQVCSYIAEITSTGAMVRNFNAEDANAPVQTIIQQRDGSLVLGGSFTLLGNYPRPHLCWIRPSGAIDPNLGVNIDADVNSIAIDTDGSLLIAGPFTKVGGVPRRCLARISTNGIVDSSFVPAIQNGIVNCVAVKADGRIVIGGNFSATGVTSNVYLAYVQRDGTVNPVAGLNNTVTSIATQCDGKMIVAGQFTQFFDISENYLGRFNADDTLDETFLPAPDAPPLALALQSDGKLLVGGGFSQIAGRSARLARLEASTETSATVLLTNSALLWLRTGSGPEVSWATFSVSTNAVDWTVLGDGARIAGGWQLTNVSVPSNCIVRARGMVNCGYRNASTYFVENTTIIGRTSAPILSIADGMSSSVSNRFRFQIQGLSGQLTVVDGSSNLFDWIPVCTNTNAFGTITIQDDASTNVPQKYYRLRFP